MPFLSFPSDVILGIALMLDLAEAVVLLSTCTMLREYSFEKSFWLSALDRVRGVQMHPIAVPVGQDLSNLTAVEIREAGLRTNRLMKNWSAKYPTPESVRAMHMDPMTEIIVIPGTNLLISHCQGFVACWDIATELCVGRLPLDPDFIVNSASFEEYGKAMLGVLFGNGLTISVSAVCVDYHDCGAVSISLVVAHSFQLPQQRQFSVASQVVVDHSQVRVIAATFESLVNVYYLLSVSFSGEARIIENIFETTQSIGRIPPIFRILFPNHDGVDFLRRLYDHADIAHVPTRTTAKPSTSKVQRRIPISFGLHTNYTPAAPIASVVNVAKDHPKNIVEFWHAVPTLDGGLAITDVYSHGFDWPNDYPVVGASGVYTLHSFIDPRTPRNEGVGHMLTLFRYIPGGAPIIRELWIRAKLNIEEGRLALDDHLGIILLLRRDGLLHIVSYA
ncbi:hypothetical protein DFH08DRAFT_831876 [Mycena albidolilacea]|uniref:F-box domain-containing protein n=1 Tax=Mycena albidolilacea TaxID=1033008 RepID=A0AAD7AV94_9AGAR|nr:hypothetical protein DFH08DRAFT_831876 [Mycena albidolilacea]